MKKTVFSIGIIAGLLVMFSLIVKPAKAWVSCDVGTHCTAWSTVCGCSAGGSCGSPGPCDYQGTPGNCSCTRSCDSCAPDCTPSWSGWSCGSCVNPGGCGNVTPTQTCTRSDGCGNTQTSTNNCAQVCNECGPYGSVHCGNWSISYDCAQTQSGCQECGPHYDNWAACVYPGFNRTRTYWKDCGAGGQQTETCYGTIQGTIFDASVVSDCSTIATQPKVVGAGVTITGTVNGGGTYNTSTNANGAYSQGSILIPETYDLTYTVDNTKWVADPPKLLCDGLLSGISMTNQGQLVQKRIGLYRIYGGWFQSLGGDLYGHTGISVTIPATCALPANQATCNSYDAGGGNWKTPLLVDATSATGTLPGSAVYGSGNLSLGGGGPAAPNAIVSKQGWSSASSYDGKQTGYDYFTGMSAHYSAGSMRNWDGNGKPSGSDSNLYKSTVQGTLTLDGATVSPGAGEKIVIFHNGNVSITSDILTPTGSYFAVIASGTITIQPGVQNIQGVFIGSSIQVPSSGDKASEVRLLAQGTFVGWNGVLLARDRGLTNNSESSELFTFRPDFVVNAPFGLRLPQIRWQEVNP